MKLQNLDAVHEVSPPCSVAPGVWGYDLFTKPQIKFRKMAEIDLTGVIMSPWGTGLEVWNLKNNITVSVFGWQPAEAAEGWLVLGTLD